MKIVRNTFIFLFRNVILIKKIINSKNSLAYNLSQHLVFLFKRRIDYEPEVWMNIKPFIKEDSLVFDIGANIGQYAIRFSELVVKGKVVSVEPDPGNLPFLYFNKEINKSNNIEILNVGIGAINGKKNFYRDLTTGGRISSFNPDKSLVPTEVETITLDKLTSHYGIPDFVKIDVEGLEIEVIKSLTFCDNKTTFLIEVRENTKKIIFDYFRHKDYLCYCVDTFAKYKIETSSSIPCFANLLFVKDYSI